MNTPSNEQIKAWKEKHGDVFMVTVEDKHAILHKPSRKTLSAALTFGQRDPMKFAETILKNCWIEGDEEIRSNDEYFLAVSSQLDQLIEQKAAEIKKL